MSFRKCFLLLLHFSFFSVVCGQAYTEIGFKDKPKRFENKRLRAEKTGDKKFGVITRVFQNNFSHYNYYFNANAKLNEIYARAKASFKDDYTKLLPYYNYSLDATAQEKDELDSVLYKSTAGIALHDLRSNWVDNFLMLIGQVYFLKKDMDSAYQIFQFVNYAYAPKEDGGYDVPIGSNASNTEGIFTIATNEKKTSAVNKTVGFPPSRNEALLWLSRVFIERKQYGEAIGLLQMLNNDPQFPKRLKYDLAELNGYLYYRQGSYDSAAHFILASLKKAENNTEKARKEFLAAQLYAFTGQHDLAVEFFERSAKHTNDPVMEVNASLNAIKNGNPGAGEIDKKVNALLKMARKDRYDQYRDVIYYTAAKALLENNKLEEANEVLLKSVKYSDRNNQQKNQSFLLLGDIHYDLKRFSAAGAFYDSLNISLLAAADAARINYRKPLLNLLNQNILDIKKQDSLQYVATLSDAERRALEKKERKKNRRRGGKEVPEEEPSYGSSGLSGSTVPTGDLFSPDVKGGEWYFNSQSLKSKGSVSFVQKWGKRPNVDNWRRQSAIETTMLNPLGLQSDVSDVDAPVDGKPESDEKKIDILPVTPEEVKASNAIIKKALFDNAAIYGDGLGEYPEAEKTYLELLNRFNNELENKDEVLFRAIYAARKNGHFALADSLMSILKQNYSNSTFTLLQTNPQAYQLKKRIAADAYEKVYNLFIEGAFSEAVAAKKKADSVFGKDYWTQQLLFIESIYYVRQKEDSTAIGLLNELIKKDSKSPLAERAATMIDVLKRRKQIENYLTNLEIERREDNYTPVVDLNSTEMVSAPQKHPAPKQPTAPIAPKELKNDSLFVPKQQLSNGYSFNVNHKQYVAVVLNKVEQVFINEASNSFSRYNKSNFYNQTIPASVVPVDAENKLLLLGPFPNASDAVTYVSKVKPVTSARILPWLEKTKYYFIIISDSNLDILKENKNLGEYRQLLNTVLPDL